MKVVSNPGGRSLPINKIWAFSWGVLKILFIYFSNGSSTIIELSKAIDKQGIRNMALDKGHSFVKLKQESAREF